jgi:hypothetical protein
MRIRLKIRDSIWLVAFIALAAGWCYDRWTLMHRDDPIVVSYPIKGQNPEAVCQIVQTVYGHLPEVQISVDKKQDALNVFARPSQHVDISVFISQCGSLGDRRKEETLTDVERGLQEFFGERETIRLFIRRHQ